MLSRPSTPGAISRAATVGTAVASPANADPNRAADTVLCRTYNSDLTAGDTYDLQATLQQDAGTVSPKLMEAMHAVVNSGASLQKDLKTQIKVTADCAMVHSGVSPGM